MNKAITYIPTHSQISSDFIQQLIGEYYQGGAVLETGCGMAEYRHLFSDYTGLDVPHSSHATNDSVDVYADAHALPFASESFEFAFTICALYLFDDPERACREIWRCLTKQGRYLIIDYTDSAKQMAVRNNLQQGRNRQFHFWPESSLSDLLMRAGFSSQKRLYVNPKSRLLSHFSLKWVDSRDTWLVYLAKK